MLFTRQEIAAFLKVSTTTIDRYEKAGMPVLRPPSGGDPRYEEKKVIEWLSKNRESGEEKGS